MNNLINKQAVMDAMWRLYYEDIDRFGVEIAETFDAERACEAIETIPSAQFAQDLHSVSTDTISRQVAIDILEGHLNADYLDGYEYLNELKAIPSVQPQRMRGHRIKDERGYTRCDQCGSRLSAVKANYCSHCGADMRGNE